MPSHQSINLKPDLAADHAAEAGTAGPAAADLALEVQVAVFIADGDATAAAVALVVGIGRARKPSRRGAGIGIGKVNGLHLSEKRSGWGFKGGYDMRLENIFISVFDQTHFFFDFRVFLCVRSTHNIA